MRDFEKHRRKTLASQTLMRRGMGRLERAIARGVCLVIRAAPPSEKAGGRAHSHPPSSSDPCRRSRARVAPCFQRLDGATCRPCLKEGRMRRTRTGHGCTNAEAESDAPPASDHPEGAGAAE